MISNILAKNNVNILSVNQNIMDGYFNMVMMAQVVDGSKIKLGELQQMLKDKGAEMNLDIKIQNQEIFNVMHNI